MQVGQLAQLGWNRPGQRVVVEWQVFQVGQLAQLGWNRPGVFFLRSVLAMGSDHLDPFFLQLAHLTGRIVGFVSNQVLGFVFDQVEVTTPAGWSVGPTRAGSGRTIRSPWRSNRMQVVVGLNLVWPISAPVNPCPPRTPSMKASGFVQVGLIQLVKSLGQVHENFA